MAQNSQADDVDAALEAQLRECFGRVVYATKTHEKCADRCMTKLGRIKFWQIVLSALTTSGLIAAIFGGDKLSYPAVVTAAVVSMALLALNTYTKDSDPGQQAGKHKKTASELWNVRESYLSVLTDLHDRNMDAKTAREKRDELQGRLASIYENAPRTSSKAYADASVGLKEREELTFSDAEIDAFLPRTLRRGE
ncbi:SLATT domain-containing protein [Burkholderia sp. S171]|uniref:SLATT domain-containing protein n=1 Tax=Burkholderia sp. S171 TaxID=1641860 RepID=UPI00131ACF0B|nr:SLATT domain-containing protein [Burkholderia sp. S171]